MNHLDQIFKIEQFIPRRIHEVFDFFSQAENLEKITPTWLHFQITAVSTPQIQRGTLIDYQLRIHGIPVKWKTEIQRWEPPYLFQDTQLRGPYDKWEHTHRFKEVHGGTQIFDEVIYKLPGGKLGNFVAGNWVRKEIESIFRFRSKKILEILN